MKGSWQQGASSQQLLGFPESRDRPMQWQGDDWLNSIAFFPQELGRNQQCR